MSKIINNFPRLNLETLEKNPLGNTPRGFRENLIKNLDVIPRNDH